MISTEESNGFKTTFGLSGICPFCTYRTDCAAGIGDSRSRTPLPGDASICIACAEVSFFTEGGLRKPTDAEKLALMVDVQILTAQSLVRRLPRRTV